MKKLILLTLLGSFTQSILPMSDGIKNTIDKKIDLVIGNDLLMIALQQPITELIQNNLQILQECNDTLKKFSPTDAKGQPLQVKVNGLKDRNMQLKNLLDRHHALNGNTPI